jgi:hypothetical protein
MRQPPKKSLQDLYSESMGTAQPPMPATTSKSLDALYAETMGEAPRVSAEDAMARRVTPEEGQRAFTRTFLSSLPGAEMVAGVVEKMQGGDYQRGRQAFAAKREEAKEKLGTIPRLAATMGGEMLPYLVGGPATIMGRALMAGTIGAIRGASKAGLEEAEAPSMLQTAKEAGTEAAKEIALEKVGNLVGIAAQAARTPTRSAILASQKAARAAESGPAYQAFREMGQLPLTAGLRDVFQTPAVQKALGSVLDESTELRKLPLTDAKVLDAVYKRIGSKTWARNQNFQELKETRTALLDAINDAAVQKATAQAGSDPAAIAALLSTPYKTPVEAFARGSELIQSTLRGTRGLRTAARGGAASERTLMEYGPTQLAEWARTATPEQREAAIRGVYAQVKEFPKTRRLLMPSQQLLAASDVLGAFGARPSVLQRGIRGAFASGLPE